MAVRIDNSLSVDKQGSKIVGEMEKVITSRTGVAEYGASGAAPLKTDVECWLFTFFTSRSQLEDCRIDICVGGLRSIHSTDLRH